MKPCTEKNLAYQLVYGWCRSDTTGYMRHPSEPAENFKNIDITFLILLELINKTIA